MTKFLLFCAFLVLQVCNSYKILVYSNLLGHSHVKMLGSVADVLTDAGHNVTILMPIIDTAERGKYGTKSTKQFIFVEPDESIANFAERRKEFQKNMWKEDTKNPLVMISKAKQMAEMFAGQCHKVLSSTELLEQIKAENYDLALTEPFDLCAYALFEAVNIRAHVAVLAASRFEHVSSVLGQPMASSYVPGVMSGFSEKMTMKERFINTLQAFGGGYFFSYIGDYEFEKVKDVAKINRSWREVLPEASYVFTNQIPILDFPAPTFDKIIPIGGISVNTKRGEMKLPEKWDKILNIRKKNVFISFGSNARSMHMPEEYKKSLLQVFSSMPDVTFIWKYEDENDKLADHLKNVYLGSWLPQNELLADPRLNVFVTHGGLASTWELSLLGKPCVMIPLFADQNRNAAMLQRHGGVEVLNKDNLDNPDLLQKTIKKVLNNPNYKKNAENLAEKLNNLPTNPREVLVKHVEFAAKFGKLPSLDNYGRHLSIIQYYLIDIFAIIFGILLITILMPIIDTGERGKHGTKSTKQFIFVEPDESISDFAEQFKDFQKNMWKEDSTNPLTIISRAGQMASTLGGQCKKVLSSTELLEQIKAVNYDVAIAEPFDMCAYAFSKL
ncbi:unnamed protein product [Caenorhabditis angaria]|uniref:glucuronosyltransferase n=1 Tax=Caenorhabditis angaria TaxID=860376 RepID=A0A9P1IUS9_9PELO|nr:unnamed protein product [Caenorhabditis angaria]